MNNQEEAINRTRINLSRLAMINRKINSTMNLNDLLTIIFDIAKDLVEAEGASLLLSDLETGDLIFNTVIGEKGDVIKGERVPKGMGIAGTVAETGNPLIVNDPQNDTRFFKDIDSKYNYTTRNILCVPMKVMEKMVGVLEVVNALGRDGFDEWDRKLISYLAEMAAIAISNRRLYHDLTNRIEELTALYEISQVISFSSPDENILNKIVQSVADLIGVEKASIILYDPHKEKLVLKASYGLPNVITTESEIDMMKSIAGFVFKNGDPLIVSDINKDLSFPIKNTDRSYKTHSFISIPLRRKNQLIGVMNLADKRNLQCFDAFDLRVLSTLGSQIAEIYENIQYQRDIISQKRLAQEIDIASEIQRKILPIIPETVNNHRIAAFNKPAKEVGGDFYDFFKFDDNKFTLLVADVSGKGIPSAIFMGIARNVIRAETRFNNQPKHLLTHSNKFIFEDSEFGMFVTLFYMLVDSHNNLITFGSGGHNDQIFIRYETKEIVKLNAGGKALGVDSDSAYEERVILFKPDDMILLFTDGVLEALGDRNIDLGEKNLIDIALKYIDRDPHELIEYLKDYLNNNSQDKDVIDDFTIVVIKF